MDLSETEIRQVLDWAAATDFEAKLNANDLPLIERLCAVVGEDVDDYAGVYIAVRDEPEPQRGGTGL